MYKQSPMANRPRPLVTATPRAPRRGERSWMLATTCAVVWTLTVVAPALAQAPCKDQEPVLKKDCPSPLAWESARGLGLALGLRSSAASTSALFYNPAGLVLGGAYHVEGNVDYLSGSKTTALGAAVADSATSQLAGGVAFRGFLSGKEGYDGFDARLGLAFPFSEAISIGLAGRYINVSTEGEDEDGNPIDVELAQGITLDASFRFQVGDVAVFDVAAYNFVDQDTALMPLELGFSAGFMLAPEFVFGFDILGDMGNFEAPSMTAGGGLEYLAAGTVPLRGGYSFDTTRELHRLGLGVGYTDKMLGVDLGFRQDLSGGDETRVLLALRYYVR